MAELTESEKLDKLIEEKEAEIAIMLKKAKTHYFIMGGKAIDFFKEGDK